MMVRVCPVPLGSLLDSTNQSLFTPPSPACLFSSILLTQTDTFFISPSTPLHHTVGSNCCMPDVMALRASAFFIPCRTVESEPFYRLSFFPPTRRRQTRAKSSKPFPPRRARVKKKKKRTLEKRRAHRFLPFS